MKVKVIAEDYKDIQVFKDMIDKESKRIIAEVEENFMAKQNNILSQIDEYLKGIALQLKDTKAYGWEFYVRGETTMVKVYFTVDGKYRFKIRINQHSDCYDSTIQNGDLIIESKYNSVLEKKQQHIELIIKYWKELKKSIHDGILEDLERSQKAVGDNLNNVMKRKAIFDDFEI